MKLYKYPRTLHLPWSEGISSDDKVLYDLSNFYNKEIVVTEKMDGENTNLYSNYYHARSINSKNHISQHAIKKLHSIIKHDIPENYRVCGENLYAKHSIRYNELLSYLLVFSIWENDCCLSWEETLEWCELLNLQTVPILYEGIYNIDIIKNLFTGISKCGGLQEGYVIRIKDSFIVDDFL